jgi:hypothetical protein
VGSGNALANGPPRLKVRGGGAALGPADVQGCRSGVHLIPAQVHQFRRPQAVPVSYKDNGGVAVAVAVALAASKNASRNWESGLRRVHSQRSDAVGGRAAHLSASVSNFGFPRTAHPLSALPTPEPNAKVVLNKLGWGPIIVRVIPRHVRAAEFADGRGKPPALRKGTTKAGGPRGDWSELLRLKTCRCRVKMA